MRAVLFASATATTRLGRRRRSPITQGSALVAFERSRLALAPLISSRRKYWLPRLDMPPRRHIQARQPIFASAADQRRQRQSAALEGDQCQSLGDRAAATATEPSRGGGTGEQDGAHRLGGDAPAGELPAHGRSGLGRHPRTGACERAMTRDGTV